jgi:2-phosphosulfolactate phosphatase
MICGFINPHDIYQSAADICGALFFDQSQSATVTCQPFESFMSQLPKLEVCLSPALLHLYNPEGTITVIIDVFRATSTIAAALDNGAKCVVPVSDIDECIRIGKETTGSITAGERDGRVAPGLQHGNSPLEYPRSFIEGKTLILTTTNGTRLLHMVQGADTIITGSFLNLTAVCDYLIAQKKPVLLGCAAWKDRFNLEDTLFAGAVVDRISECFSINCDSARAARALARQAHGAFLDHLEDSSHYHRLAGFGLQEDLAYCTTPDLHPVVPVLKGTELVLHQA